MTKIGKMLRYLLVLVALSVSVKAQTTTSPANPLPNEIRLDADFILTWGVSNNTITIDLYANTAGWLSMGLLSDDGNLLDVWWGGFDEDFGVPYLQVIMQIYTNLCKFIRIDANLYELMQIYTNIWGLYNFLGFIQILEI